MFADHACSLVKGRTSACVALFALAALIGVTPLCASAQQDMVLLDFAADWCGPCRRMDPIISRLKTEGLPVRRVNVDREQALVRQFNVRGYPTFIMLVQGREIERVSGYTPEARLRQMLARGRSKLAAPRGQSPDGFPGKSGPPKMIPVPKELQELKDPFLIKPGGTTRPAPSPPSTTMVPAPKSFRPTPGGTTRQVEGNPKAKAMAASVRLKVDENSSISFGSGTIIHTQGTDALVVTCSHIFRSSNYQGKIEVTVQDGEKHRTVPGKLIAWNEKENEPDVALVVITPGFPVQSVDIVPSRYRPGVGDHVFSVGCDNGGPRRMMESKITSIGRYIGPPNFEASKAPTEGRSGGGIFTVDGRLLGICNCADYDEGKGIYASISNVYEQLKQKKLEDIFQENTPSGEMIAPGPSFAPKASPTGGSSTDVICIIRDPNGQRRTVILDRASPHFLQAISEEQLRQNGNSTAVAGRQ